MWQTGERPSYYHNNNYYYISIMGDNSGGEVVSSMENHEKLPVPIRGSG